MKQPIWACLCVFASFSSAQVCSKQPLPPEVLPALCEELRANPRGSLQHYRLAEQLYEAGNYQDAANEYREALNGNLEPESMRFWSHIGLGRIFATTQQWDRAAKEFDQAVAARSGTDGEAQMRALQDLAAMAPAKAGPLTVPTPPRVLQLSAATPPVAEPVETVPADYNDEAKVAELEGTVVLAATIGDDGVASNLMVYHSLGLGLDQKAIESAKQWLFSTSGVKPQSPSLINVDFLFPAKSSRWHLLGVRFETLEGVSRPTFLKAKYPIGAGIFTTDAVEEGRILGAIGRDATATISFDIDERGIPINPQVEWMSDKCWGPEAVALVEEWRFTPAMKDGKPVRMRASFDLAWGPINLTATAIQRDRSGINVRIPDATPRAFR